MSISQFECAFSNRCDSLHSPQESISTCKFATRVACIRQDAVVNEEVDPQVVIKRLKKEIQELKEELVYYRGGEGGGEPLTDSELRR